MRGVPTVSFGSCHGARRGGMLSGEPGVDEPPEKLPRGGATGKTLASRASMRSWVRAVPKRAQSSTSPFSSPS